MLHEKRQANKAHKVKACSKLILHPIYLNQCILEFRINKKYLIHVWYVNEMKVMKEYFYIVQILQ